MAGSGNSQHRLSGTDGVSQRSNNSISSVLRNLPLKRIHRNSEIEIEIEIEIEWNETLIKKQTEVEVIMNELKITEWSFDGREGREWRGSRVEQWRHRRKERR